MKDMRELLEERSGGVERYRCCRFFSYTEGGIWVSKAEVGFTNVPEAEVSWKCTEETQKSAGHVKAQPQTRRAVARRESAETQDCVSASMISSQVR